MDSGLDEDNSKHCMQCGHVEHQVLGSGRLADLLQTLGSDDQQAADSLRRLMLEQAQPIAI